MNYINPEIRKSYVNCVMEKVAGQEYHLKNENLDMRLFSLKKPLLVGGKGFLDLNSKTTFYYSLTNLKAEGIIKIKDKWIEVSGKSWMDHQWANSAYSKDRWDWFSIQLENDTEIVCCVYDNRKKKTYFADISYPDNRQEHYRDLQIIPAQTSWKSARSKAVYPLMWNIRIPAKNIDLRLTARIKNQEMLFGSINYWEGPLEVHGYFGKKKVRGVGFMELVGYPSRYNAIEYFREETMGMVNWFAHGIKKRLSVLVGNRKKRK